MPTETRAFRFPFRRGGAFGAPLGNAALLSVFGVGMQPRSPPAAQEDRRRERRLDLPLIWCRASTSSKPIFSKEQLSFRHPHGGPADAHGAYSASVHVDLETDARGAAHLDPLRDPVAMRSVHRFVMGKDRNDECATGETRGRALVHP